MDFKIKLDDKQLDLFIQERVMELSKASVRDQLAVMFKDRVSYDHTKQKQVHEQGVATLVVGEMIDKKLSDINIQKHIEKYVEEELDKYLKAAMEKACQHVANKAVFIKTKLNNLTN